MVGGEFCGARVERGEEGLAEGELRHSELVVGVWKDAGGFSVGWITRRKRPGLEVEITCEDCPRKVRMSELTKLRFTNWR